MQMYSKEVGTGFGNIMNSSLSNMDNYINAGQYCKSGMAIPTKLGNTNYVECVEINSIYTNFDGYGAKQDSPYPCILSPYKEYACRYYYYN
jgi:hypothetical protein